jgi:hypothetical protein
MSAWWCGTAHVNALLSYWHNQGRCTPTTATNLGRDMLKANADSLAARYPDGWLEMIPEDEDIGGYRFVRDNAFLKRPNLHADAIALCECFDYQSCEFDGWSTCGAKLLIDAILQHATDKAGGAAKSELWGWPP